LEVFKLLTVGLAVVEEHPTHYTKDEGLSPAASAGTRGVKMANNSETAADFLPVSLLLCQQQWLDSSPRP